MPGGRPLEMLTLKCGEGIVLVHHSPSWQPDRLAGPSREVPNVSESKKDIKPVQSWATNRQKSERHFEAKLGSLSSCRES